MGKIQKLSDIVIDKIAAGEVVENPASCVKELIENALDAGAKNICVEIEEGGLAKIVVSDDGSGMNPRDAKASLERHATSKIRSEEDLIELVTFGFRGEALASIAAISHMRLITAEDGMVATIIEMQGGVITKETSGARARGTTVEIRNLFYNTPARKKFQKSVRALSSEMTKTVTELALAYPQSSFTLKQNGFVLIEPSAFEHADFADKLFAKAKKLLGADLLEGAARIDYEEGPMKVIGYIASVSKARMNRTGQYIFLHQRVIQAQAVSYAVKDALSTMLGDKLHPVFILHLFLPLNWFDVNVHPQKKEVRFIDERALRSFLENAVRKCFFKAPIRANEVGREKEAIKEFTFSEPGYVPKDVPWIFRQEPINVQLEMPCQELIFGFWNQRYLFIEKEAHLQIFDAANAANSLLFTIEQEPDSTPLLMPIVLMLSPFEVQKILSHESELVKLGFSLRAVDGSGLWCEAHPSLIKPEEIKDFLLDFPNKKLICQKTLKKRKISQQEAMSLLDQVKKHNLSIGIDGKPLFTTISLERFDELFKS